MREFVAILFALPQLLSSAFIRGYYPSEILPSLLRKLIIKLDHSNYEIYPKMFYVTKVKNSLVSSRGDTLMYSELRVKAQYRCVFNVVK